MIIITKIYEEGFNPFIAAQIPQTLKAPITVYEFGTENYFNRLIEFLKANFKNPTSSKEVVKGNLILNKSGTPFHNFEKDFQKFIEGIWNKTGNKKFKVIVTLNLRKTKLTLGKISRGEYITFPIWYDIMFEEINNNLTLGIKYIITGYFYIVSNFKSPFFTLLAGGYSGKLGSILRPIISDLRNMPFSNFILSFTHTLEKIAKL
jgi:hypothetical protein